MGVELLTVRETARMLSMSGRNVLKLCRAGKISFHQDGRWFRIPRESVMLYMHNTYFEQKKLQSSGTSGTTRTPLK